MDDLSQRMQKQPFSLATDGGNDQGKLKQFPLVVTIEGETGLVNPELLALQPCEGKAFGENISGILKREFEIRQIPWRNCIAFGCDSASVMTGHINGVIAHIKEHHDDVHLARCCLHMVHNAAKYGSACLPKIENCLTDIYYYFQKSTKRKDLLHEYQDLYHVTQDYMLKHVSTTWLSIKRCWERLVKNWQPLAHLFQDEKKKLDELKERKKKKQQKKIGETEQQQKLNDSVGEDHYEIESETYASKKVEAIYDCMKSRTNKLYCTFLLYTMKVYDQVLLDLQEEKPLIFTLRKSLLNLLTDLYQRFVTAAAVKDRDVKKVEFDKRENQKADGDLLIGS